MIEKAVFLGSKKFGLHLFKALKEASDVVSWSILCPSDLSDPRSQLEAFRDFAENTNVELLVVPSAEAVTRYVKEQQPDIVVVCGYYRILPSEVIDGVRHGVWGIHNSLLPKYRGGSPLVWQMINNEKILGSSFFRFRSGVDDGEVLDQVSVEHSPELTIQEATDLIEKEWAERIPGIWKSFCEGDVAAVEQDHGGATYCAQRQESDGLIDWRRSASELDCFIRAQATPYPRAFFRLGQKDIKIVAHHTDGRRVHGMPGQVFEVRDDYVTICCGDTSVIRLCTVEEDGKERPAAEIITSFKQRL